MASDRRDSSLQTFYDTFRNIPTLSGKDERTLLLRIKKGDSEAYQKFLLANMRLVISRALKFAPSGDPRIMDMVSEGTLGLIRAVERFDCGRNLRFSTYAVGWIESFIRRSLKFFQKETQATIRNLKRRFERGEEILRKATGENPTDDEVAIYLKWPPYLIQVYKKHSNPKVRVSHDPFALDNAPSNAPHPIAKEENKELKEKIAHLLHHLTPVEEDMLRRHYGLGREEETYKTLSEFYGIARERVRQIENDALRKLFLVLREKENPFGIDEIPEGGLSFRRLISTLRTTGRVPE